MERCKKASVVIVGAGPAGSACASALALKGIGPVVLLDRASFPRRKPCAGGIGPGADGCLKAIGAWDVVARASNVVTGMKAVTPSEKELRVRGPVSALVLPREKLDTILIEHAQSLGVEVLTGKRVVCILRDQGYPSGVVSGNGTRVEAIWTVVASGGGSKLPGAGKGRRLGRVLKAVMARYEGMEVSASDVEMYFDRDLKPMYGWVFPEGNGAANVGVCYDWNRFPGRKAGEVFNTFAGRYLADRLRRARRAAPLSGSPIYTTFAPEGIAEPGLLVAGEAGWLVNPATGEGIHQALRSGIWAADAIFDHIKGRASARDAASSYEKRVKAGLRPGLIAGEIFRLVGPTLLDLAAALKG